MRPPLKFHFQLAHCLVHQLLEPSRQLEKHPQRVLYITAFNQLLIYAYAKQKRNLPKQPLFFKDELQLFCVKLISIN